ncbi:winged helix-turn-helix domain-containing protein [Serratia marcescens]|uniref:winged helix-turn-helix domain-containing protein n=1 Tax=Serratia TaxID=613 RepID=UPI003BA29F3C
MISDLNTELTLSNQAARLLLEMVSNRDVILHREELLKRVWEDYGFSGSNNSLNVTISELRKSFANMGLDPKIITTIHKVGFRFNGNVAVIPDGNQSNKEPDPYINHHSPVGNNLLKKKNWGIPPLKKLAFSVLALLLIAYIIYEATFDIKKSIVKEESKTFVYRFKKCNAYTLSNYSITKDELAPILSSENFDCEKETDVFFKARGEKNKVFKTDFIGSCMLDKNGDYKNCRSINNIGDI